MRTHEAEATDVDKADEADEAAKATDADEADEAGAGNVSVANKAHVNNEAVAFNVAIEADAVD